MSNHALITVFFISFLLFWKDFVSCLLHGNTRFVLEFYIFEKKLMSGRKDELVHQN